MSGSTCWESTPLTSDSGCHQNPAILLQPQQPPSFARVKIYTSTVDNPTPWYKKRGNVKMDHPRWKLIFFQLWPCGLMLAKRCKQRGKCVVVHCSLRKVCQGRCHIQLPPWPHQPSFTHVALDEKTSLCSRQTEAEAQTRNPWNHKANTEPWMVSLKGLCQSSNCWCPQRWPYLVIRFSQL